MKKFEFIFVLLIVLLGINLADAETGNISVNTGYGAQSGTYNRPIGAQVMAFNTFDFYLDGYSTIHSLTLIPDSSANGQPRYAYDAETTTFTITSGGTGSGTVSYNKAYNEIDWIFNDGNVITAKQFTVTYAKPSVLTNITPPATTGAGVCHGSSVYNYYYFVAASANSATLTQPVSVVQATDWNYPYDNGATCDYGHHNYLYWYQYGSVGATVVNTYNVTYPSPGWFSVSVNKSMSTTATKWFIHNATNKTSYSYESTFNTNSYNPTAKYGNQLWLNMTLANGMYSDVLINATVVNGGSGAPLTPDTVIFNTVNPAYVGSPFGVGWNISSFDTAWHGYYFTVTGPSGDEATSQDIVTQVGTTGSLFKFGWLGCVIGAPFVCHQQDGYWTVSLYSYSLIWGRYFPTLIDTDTVLVNPAAMAGGFLLSTDKKNYTVGEIITFSGVNPSASTVYITVFDNNYANVPVLGMSPNNQIPAGMVFSYGEEVGSSYPAGGYTAIMAGTESYTPILNSTNFTIDIPASLTGNMGLMWADVYQLQDIGMLKYVNGFNTSTLTLYFNDGQGGNNYVMQSWSIPVNGSGVKQVLFDRAGNYRAQLVDNGNPGVCPYCWANVSVWPSDSPIQPVIGPNKKAEYVNWDKTTYYPGDAYRLKYQISPLGNSTTSKYYLRLKDPYGSLILNIKMLDTSTSFNNPYISFYDAAFTPKASTGKWYASIVKLNLSDNETASGALIDGKFTDVLDKSGNVSATAPPGYNGSNWGGTGGYSPDETNGDFIGNYKQMVYTNIGTSAGTLFFMGIMHMLIFGIICIVASKGMPIMFALGAMAGLGFSVSINFIPLVWGVVIVVLAGMVFMGMMKKG